MHSLKLGCCFVVYCQLTLCVRLASFCGSELSVFLPFSFPRNMLGFNPHMLAATGTVYRPMAACTRKLKVYCTLVETLIPQMVETKVIKKSNCHCLTCQCIGVTTGKS